ncbi:MAG: hypothetical protein R2880_00415 [Deinococcales bacterium]
MPVRFYILCLVLAWSAGLGGARAQPLSISALRLGHELYLSLEDVAGILGYGLTQGGISLTIYPPQGVLIVFENSPDVLWTVTGRNASPRDNNLSLASPVLKQEGRWYAPDELFALFNINVRNNRLSLPTGQEVLLNIRSPIIERGGHAAPLNLGNDVMAINFYLNDNQGTQQLSLMLIDASLLALAFPDQRNSIDSFMAKVKEGRPLFFVVTALKDMPWSPELEFSQGAENFTAKPPLSLSILAGKNDRVSPDKAVSGVILLPSSFDLREAIEVEWQGLKTSFQFRR